jgi:hypothetical protein
VTSDEPPKIERYARILDQLGDWYHPLAPAILAHREEYPDGDLDHVFFGIDVRKELVRAANAGDRNAVSQLLQFIEALARFPPRADILGLLDATIIPVLLAANEPDDKLTSPGSLLIHEAMGPTTAALVAARRAEYAARRVRRGPVSRTADRIAESVARWIARARH